MARLNPSCRVSIHPSVYSPARVKACYSGWAWKETSEPQTDKDYSFLTTFSRGGGSNWGGWGDRKSLSAFQPLLPWIWQTSSLRWMLSSGKTDVITRKSHRFIFCFLVEKLSNRNCWLYTRYSFTCNQHFSTTYKYSVDNQMLLEKLESAWSCDFPVSGAR